MPESGGAGVMQIGDGDGAVVAHLGDDAVAPGPGPAADDVGLDSVDLMAGPRERAGAGAVGVAWRRHEEPPVTTRWGRLGGPRLARCRSAAGQVFLRDHPMRSGLVSGAAGGLQPLLLTWENCRAKGRRPTSRSAAGYGVSTRGLGLDRGRRGPPSPCRHDRPAAPSAANLRVAAAPGRIARSEPAICGPGRQNPRAQCVVEAKLRSRRFLNHGLSCREPIYSKVCDGSAVSLTVENPGSRLVNPSRCQLGRSSRDISGP